MLAGGPGEALLAEGRAEVGHEHAHGHAQALEAYALEQRMPFYVWGARAFIGCALYQDDARIEALGGWEKIMEELKKRQEELRKKTEEIAKLFAEVVIAPEVDEAGGEQAPPAPPSPRSVRLLTRTRGAQSWSRPLTCRKRSSRRTRRLSRASISGCSRWPTTPPRWAATTSSSRMPCQGLSQPGGLGNETKPTLIIAAAT